MTATVTKSVRQERFAVVRECGSGRFVGYAEIIRTETKGVTSK